MNRCGRHAAPLSAVDDVRVETDGDGYRVWATKMIRADDPYMVGHFPGQPIYPGVFVLETVGQALTAALGHEGGELLLAELVSVRFTAPLLVGDALTVHAQAGQAHPAGRWHVRARCLRSDQVPSARVTARYRTAAAQWADQVAGSDA